MGNFNPGETCSSDTNRSALAVSAAFECPSGSLIQKDAEHLPLWLAWVMFSLRIWGKPMGIGVRKDSRGVLPCWWPCAWPPHENTMAQIFRFHYILLVCTQSASISWNPGCYPESSEPGQSWHSCVYPCATTPFLDAQACFNSVICCWGVTWTAQKQPLFIGPTELVPRTDYLMIRFIWYIKFIRINYIKEACDGKGERRGWKCHCFNPVIFPIWAVFYLVNGCLLWTVLHAFVPS